MKTKAKKRDSLHLLARSAIMLGMLCQGVAMAAQPMLAAGRRHSIYVNDRGRLAIWGDNALGQLGQDYATVPQSTAPFNPMAPRLVRVLGSGWNHILAATRPTRTRNPTLWSWGYGDVGQLGIGPLVPVGFFQNYQAREIYPVLGDFSSKQFVMLQGGIAHSLALTSDGTIWSWGWNTAGQLGLGDTTNRWTAYRISALPQNMAAIAAGGDFSLALAQDGTLWGWGNNATGQLGLGSSQQPPVTLPTRLPAFGNDIRAIAAGTAFALALDASGAVWAWGDNDSGQLGRVGEPTAQPSVVPGLPPIAAIAAGGGYALALARDGALWTWGQNDRGQLGDGTITNRATPQPVPGLAAVRLMAAGVEHALALGQNDVLMAWGDDSAGQLGVSLPAGFSAVPQVVNLAQP